MCDEKKEEITPTNTAGIFNQLLHKPEDSTPLPHRDIESPPPNNKIKHYQELIQIFLCSKEILDKELLYKIISHILKTLEILPENCDELIQENILNYDFSENRLSNILMPFIWLLDFLKDDPSSIKEIHPAGLDQVSINTLISIFCALDTFGIINECENDIIIKMLVIDIFNHSADNYSDIYYILSLITNAFLNKTIDLQKAKENVKTLLNYANDQDILKKAVSKISEYFVNKNQELFAEIITNPVAFVDLFDSDQKNVLKLHLSSHDITPSPICIK